jgi:hypothetical protein
MQLVQRLGGDFHRVAFDGGDERAHNFTQGVRLLDQIPQVLQAVDVDLIDTRVHVYRVSIVLPTEILFFLGSSAKTSFQEVCKVVVAHQSLFFCSSSKTPPMDAFPLDVIRYMASAFLSDRHRLALAQVNRKARNACQLDVAPVVFDAILDVRHHEGFRQSRNGYWYVPAGKRPDQPTHPQEMGCLAAAHPWAFVQAWLHIPREVKTSEFRRQCIQSLSLQEWHADVVVAMKILRAGNASRSDKQLLRRAVWYVRKDVVCYLMDYGNVPADGDNGAALVLALSTLGSDPSEMQVAALIHELLQRGANPTRHNLWGIRMCLQMNFHIVASLMCVYAMRWNEGRQLLSSFVQELEDRGDRDLAALVRSSADFIMFV